MSWLTRPALTKTPCVACVRHASLFQDSQAPHDPPGCMTRSERLYRRLKENKFVAFAILLGSIVIGLATFKDALVKLSEPFFKTKQRLKQRLRLQTFWSPKAVQDSILN